MREILFRAKSEDNYPYPSRWEYGMPFEDSYGSYMMKTSKGLIEVKKETVGEFTGLTDKNGVKIFEGDIVKIYDSYDLAHDDAPDYQISKVFYYNGALCVEHYCSDYDFTVIGWIEDVEYEVIGNIYEGDCTT